MLVEPYSESELEQLFYDALAEIGESEMTRLINENSPQGGVILLLTKVLPKILVKVNRRQIEVLGGGPRHE